MSKDKHIIVKLVSEDYCDNFVKNGELFFGDSKRYRNIEIDEGNKWIGDKNDSHISFSKKELENNISFKIKYKDKIINIPNNELAEVNGEAIGYSVNVSIFCYVMLRISDLQSEESKEKFIYDINNTLLSDENYKKKIVLITNADEFKRRLIKSVNNEYDVYGNKVNYVKNQQNFIKKSLFDKNKHSFSDSHIEIVFSKDDIFEPEREYRIAIFREGNQRYSSKVSGKIGVFNDIKLFIGSLEDISIIYDDVESMIDSISLNPKQNFK